MLTATQERAQHVRSIAGRVLDVLFWGALAAMVGTQLTKLWWTHTGNGDRVIHLAIAGVIVMADYARRRGGLPRLVETALGLAVLLGVSVYFYINRLDLIIRSGFGPTSDLVAAVLLLVVAFRFAHYSFGWTFPILGVLAVLYAMFSSYAPGVFKGPEITIQRVLSRYASEMHGGLFTITWEYLWLLLFFGLLLPVSGVNIAVLKAAGAVSRALRAGPAMVCLMASALTGSFTGGGASNTMITGPFTIPAMKQAGYRPEEAASVEALASNASGITPPIMGAVAFIMASLLGVSYLNVVVMVLPACILWYLGVMVYLYAHFRRNRGRISNTINLPREWEAVPANLVLRSAALGVIPVGLLIVLLAFNVQLQEATLTVFIVFAVLAVALRVERRRDVWLRGIRQAAVLASSVTLVLLILAIFDRSLRMTGLEVRLAGIIYDLSAGSLILATLYMIIGGVILGAALPSLAVFFIMILTFTPVLAQFGIDRSMSFFIAFYMGNLASISPPVATGVLLAATVAGVGYWKAAWRTMLMGLPLFFFPFLFVFSPEVLLQGGDVQRIIFVLGMITVALVFLEMGAAGWMFRDLAPVERGALMATPFIAFMGLYWDNDLLLWVAALLGVAVAALSGLRVMAAQRLRRVGGQGVASG